MMVYLKRAWNLYSDVITFGWLTRLLRKNPRLGQAIYGSLLTLGLGLLTWYYVDPRFQIYEKNSFRETSWGNRIIKGVLTGSVGIGVVYFTVSFIRLDTRIGAERRPIAKRQHIKRRKKR